MSLSMIFNPFLKIWEIWAWSFIWIAFLRKGVSQLYENMRGVYQQLCYFNTMNTPLSKMFMYDF